MSTAVFPFFPQELFGHETGLVLGVAIGFFFGFVLERSGFGRGSLLAAQFYGGDNRVLKVMFSGIVTAGLGVAALSGLGVLDVSLLLVPETFLWPQLVGGLLLGVGFIVSGYCPGTSIVATASGHLDGLVTYGGVMLGALVFGGLFPWTEEFYKSGALGVVRLDDVLGLPEVVVAAAVLLMAVGAFLGVEVLERALSRRRGEPLPAGNTRVRNRVFASFAVMMAVGLGTLALPRAEPVSPPKPFTSIAPLELARTMVQDPSSVHVFDLRAPAACAAVRVPGAMCLPADDPSGAVLASLAPTRTLVLYADGVLGELPDAARRFPGEVRVLAGGFAAFKADVLTAPVLPPSAAPAQRAAFGLRAALQSHLTGAKAQAAPPPSAVPTAAPGKKKGGGC